MIRAVALAVLLVSCGPERVTVTLVARSQGLARPSDVASWDLWVLSGETREGAVVECAPFASEGFTPITRDLVVLIPPVVGAELSNDATIAVRGIPPSAAPCVFVMRLFTAPDRRGDQIGVACTRVTVPPGSHVSVDVLVQ
ncbi:MAG: hypothetical protein IT381_20275 [Deltaproteobacteria bacterium]|nr:hypothetical protein [Deltaproteobacteria bacterium]